MAVGIKIFTLGAALVFYGLPMLVISSYAYNNLSSDCKAQSLRTGLRGLMATSIITICLMATYIICKMNCKLKEGEETYFGLNIFFAFLVAISITNLVFLTQINNILKSSDPDDIKCQTNNVDYSSMVTVGFILSGMFLTVSSGCIIVPFISNILEEDKKKKNKKKVIEDNIESIRTEEDKKKQKKENEEIEQINKDLENKRLKVIVAQKSLLLSQQNKKTREDLENKLQNEQKKLQELQKKQERINEDEINEEAIKTVQSEQPFTSLTAASIAGKAAVDRRGFEFTKR